MDDSDGAQEAVIIETTNTSNDEYSGPLMGLDPRLLDVLVDSIEAAHRANPSSWSLNILASGSVILYVESVTVLIVRTGGGDIIFHGTSDEAKFEDIAKHVLKRQYAHFKAFFVAELNVNEFLMAYTAHRAAHIAVIEERAHSVATRTQRANEHNQELLDEISSRTGRAIPQPAYTTQERTPQSRNAEKYRSRTAETTGFWKQTIAPKDQITWEELKSRGELISTLWKEPDENLSLWSDDRSEFTQRAMQVEGISNGAAHRLWMFVKGMRVGDQVIVHERNRPVLGVGTIESGYEFVDARHRRRVAWTDTEQRQIGKQVIRNATEGQNLWGLTPITPNAYRTIASALGFRIDDIATPIPEDIHLEASLDDISEHFLRAGLSYSPEQIATFYTALQTKGFVVLSGISGTGKSKIAQGFAAMLLDPTGRVADTRVDPESVIQLTIKPYMRKYKRAIIPVDQTTLLTPMAPGEAHLVSLSLNGTRGTGRLKNREHQSGGTVQYLFFHNDIATEIENFSVDQALYLVPDTDPETGAVTQIDMYTSWYDLPSDTLQPLAETESRSNLFLSVRPDWRDSTSLLGYYNPLTETYEWTEFLRFLLRARESFEAKDGLAWFVILDEMNLAHVEYYFADLLSIIESGRNADGYSVEPLRFSYPETVKNDSPPRQLHLPPNLYIIGTVNMDETTHAFSPKVLDRAFTIELTDVDFSDYPPMTGSGAEPIPDAEKHSLLRAFTRNGRFAQVKKADIARTVEDHPQLRQWLINLNTRLERDRFHFGYRVFDEIAQFVHNADENKMFDSWEQAFDHAVFMKVLPKFNGSRARLLGPLLSLVAWAVDPDAPDADALKGNFRSQLAQDASDYSTLITGARFERVAERGLHMLIALEEDGFVSFG